MFELDQAPSVGDWQIDEGFGSGTLARMRQYRGLPTKDVVEKVLKEQLVDPAKASFEAARHPIATAENIAGQAYEAVRHPRRTAEKVASYYYQNPDILAQDVALTAVGGPEVKAGEAVEAAVPAASRLQRLGKEGTAPLPDPLARAQTQKAEAGAAMQAAKDETPPVPAETLQPTVEAIKQDTKSYYNPDVHKRARFSLGRLSDLLPEEEKPAFYPPRNPKLQAKIQAAEQKGAPTVAERARLEDKVRAALGHDPGKTVSVKDLHNVQQGLKDALNSPEQQERTVGMKIKEGLDDFVENKMGVPGWTAAKRRYAAASTALEMKGLVDRALYRRTNLSAGQKAQALATEFRQWARPQLDGKPNRRMRMLRALSPDAADKVETFAKGELPFDGLLRILGTAAPSSLMNVGLAEIAGHMLHGLIGAHLGPMGIMTIGAGARFLRGARAEAHIDRIIDDLLDEGSIKEEGLTKVVGPDAVAKAKSTPDGKKALAAWTKRGGKTATRALAIAIARSANMPQLVPRIENEINQIEDVKN